MIGNWLSKRRLKRRLSGCNFEMAKQILIKQFSGGVIPNELANLLDAFVSNPGTDTALDLIRYDSKLLYVFELARRGGFTERLFEEGGRKW